MKNAFHKSNRLLLTLFMLLSYAGISQGGNLTTEAKQIGFGVFFSPEISFMHETDYIKGLSTEKFPGLGYSAGLSLFLKNDKRLIIESGLSFLNQRYKINVKDLELYPDPDAPVPVFPDKATYQLQYLCIPVLIDYFMLNSKQKIFLTAGISANFLLNEKRVSKFYDYPSIYKKSADQFGDFNLGFIVGVGFDFNMSNRLFFRVSPYYRYFAPTKNKKRYLVDGNMDSIGIKIGVNHF